MTKVIRVIVADDHALVRAGTVALLRGMSGIEIVAETGEGNETLRAIREKRPDLVLMDISMPGLNGLEVAARSGVEFPDIGIIIVSMHKNEEYVRRALRIGVRGYLIKAAETRELEVAVRAVSRGETYLSPAISSQLLSDYKALFEGRPNPWASRTGLFDTLTPRERQVLQLIAEGCKTKEIAQRLFLSVKTVESHRTRMMKRLNIHDVAGLVRYAIREGMTELS